MFNQPEPWTSLDPARVIGELFDERPVTPRIARLFCCACCRLVWDRLTLPASRTAIEVSERYADGTATEAERAETHETLYRDIIQPEGLGIDVNRYFGAWTARYTSDADPETPAEMRSRLREILNSIENLASATSFQGAPNFGGWKRPEHAQKAIRAAQLSLIRCLIPEVRDRPPIPADWLTSTVTDLAASIYADHAFDRMPILADALEDAGCDDRAMLTHCRNAHRHARGCWVLDRILGKN